MEHQPNEILEYVFEQLFSIKDVQKCAKTCVRWNKIVKNKFKNWGMFLLTIFLRLYTYTTNFFKLPKCRKCICGRWCT